MSNRDRIYWITRTAILIALLIVMQAVTAPMSMFVTGSIVNLLLIISVMTCGLASGLSVAVVSPVLAKLFGIGPLWSLIPFITLGNISLILVWHFIGNHKAKNAILPYSIALVSAAVAKFAVLYIGIVLIAVPMILGLPEPQAGVISNMFSIPQLITASIGGAVATVVLPILKSALKKGQE